MEASLADALGPALAAARRARLGPGQAVVEDADAIAAACRAMAGRFHAGGRLLVFGNGGPSTDAQHVSVEFVHPVIVGKRALPALSLTNDVATLTGIANREGFSEVFAHQLRHLAQSADIALGVSADGRCANVGRALAVAREQGLLTVVLSGGDGPLSAPDAAHHVIAVRSADPLVVKELHVTCYHLLWELVHVFFEHPGALSGQVVA